MDLNKSTMGLDLYKNSELDSTVYYYIQCTHNIYTYIVAEYPLSDSSLLHSSTRHCQLENTKTYYPQVRRLAQTNLSKTFFAGKTHVLFSFFCLSVFRHFIIYNQVVFTLNNYSYLLYFYQMFWTCIKTNVNDPR